VSEIFEEELKQIQDNEIREFTRYILSKRPSYFDHVAASSTGKYHNPNENGVGGLIRHTKGVCYMAKEFASVYNFAPIDVDIVMSAAILHDICKYGIGIKQAHTTRDHDEQGAKYIQIMAKTAPPCRYLDEICRAVAAHMGRWKVGKTVVFPKDLNEIQQCLHLADVAASRKKVNIELFDEDTPLIG